MSPNPKIVEFLEIAKRKLKWEQEVHKCKIPWINMIFVVKNITSKNNFRISSHKAMFNVTVLKVYSLMHDYTLFWSLFFFSENIVFEFIFVSYPLGKWWKYSFNVFGHNVIMSHMSYRVKLQKKRNNDFKLCIYIMFTVHINNYSAM